jgi:hypothetical protein
MLKNLYAAVPQLSLARGRPRRENRTRRTALHAHLSALSVADHRAAGKEIGRSLAEAMLFGYFSWRPQPL